MDLERKLQALAVRQHGLVTRDQAADLGIGRRAWYSRLRAGTLVPAAPCVAALPGAPPSPEQRIHVAVLAAGPGAIAAGSDSRSGGPSAIEAKVRSDGGEGPPIRLTQPEGDFRPWSGPPAKAHRVRRGS